MTKGARRISCEDCSYRTEIAVSLNFENQRLCKNGVPSSPGSSSSSMAGEVGQIVILQKTKVGNDSWHGPLIHVAHCYFLNLSVPWRSFSLLFLTSTSLASTSLSKRRQ